MVFLLKLVVLLPLVHASFIGKIFGQKSPQEDTALLPQVLPANDHSYLVSFESDDYEHCKEMQPVLKRLEQDLGTIVRRINIIRRREFMGVLEAMGHHDCGTLPFYYNRRTGQAICGATTYVNLKRWGTGDLKHSFVDPPESLSQPDDHHIGPSSRKGVGTNGFLMDKLQAFERRGRDRAEKIAKLEARRKDVPLKKGAKQAKAVAKEQQQQRQDTKESAAERTAARRAARSKGKEALASPAK